MFGVSCIIVYCGSIIALMMYGDFTALPIALISLITMSSVCTALFLTVLLSLLMMYGDFRA